jgi:molybdopterin molybdotransferase
MISVNEALERILIKIAPVPSETVSLTEGAGRVLVSDLVARRTQPPFDVSAMDGYAVRAKDVTEASAILELVGESPAGSSYQGEVCAGKAVRIFTGAPVPSGADSIVIQENVTPLDDQRVQMMAPAELGRHIRRRGIDFLEGEIGLRGGQLLSARDVGLAAAMDVPWLEVTRKPRIAILATGDELTLPGDPTSQDQIVSSCPYALGSYINQWGGEAVHLGIARDNEQSLKRAAEGAHGMDLFVTIGGASVGDHDLVRDVLAEVGMNLEFWRVAMRPGKPMMFGEINGMPLLGLPGNPVSCIVCAVLFLKPTVGALLGRNRSELAPTFETARLGKKLSPNANRQDYIRATLEHHEEDQFIATPFDLQDSSVMSVLSAADCLIVRAPLAPEASAGDSVQILRL